MLFWIISFTGFVTVHNEKMNLPISYLYIIAKTVNIASGKPSSQPAAAEPTLSKRGRRAAAA